MKQKTSDKFSEAKKCTWISVVVNILLTILQIVIGIYANAQSLVADALHSLSDLIADFFVLYANKHSQQPADQDHPYGHGRYETAAGLVLGLILVITGISIVSMAATRLKNIDQVPEVMSIAFVVACFTLLAKELLFHYLLKVGKKYQSTMLIANAWHARADAASSLVVALGLLGAINGFKLADAAAAIVVGLLISRMGLEFTWKAIKELIDTGVDEVELNKLKEQLVSVPGVLGVHELRTRHMAERILLDAHILVAPHISVSEGHMIAETTRHKIKSNNPLVLDVLVHIDVENDDLPFDINAYVPIPARERIENDLRNIFNLPFTSSQIILHYLNNKVEIDLYLAAEIKIDLQQQSEQVKQLAYISLIRIFNIGEELTPPQ